MSSEHTFFSLTRNMTHKEMVMGKGAIVTILCRTIHPYEHIRNKYWNIARGKRLKNAVVIRLKVKKIDKK